MPGETLLNGALTGLSLRDDQRNWRVHPRDQLKGYSWVTVVPDDVLERLDGPDALRATGAFATVEPLPAGGGWLQATERLADYNLAAARKVFEALRPVLVKGRPTLPDDVQQLLVDEAA